MKPINENTTATQAVATGDLVRPPEAWVRVIAPGIDVACKIDDQESREIIACALAIAERRTKKNEAAKTPQQHGEAANPEGQASRTDAPTSETPAGAVPSSA